MNRRTVVISVVAGVVVIGGAGAGVAWQQQRAQAEQDRSLRAAAETFASAWSDRALDRSGTSYAGSSPAQVAASFTKVTQGLGTGPVKVTVGSVNRSGDTGKATLDVRWSLAGGATWAYSEPVSLKRTSNRWAVVADGPTSLWHPKVRSNQALTAGRTWGRRGELLDRERQAADAARHRHAVQIDPANATPAAAAALEPVVDEPAGSLTAKLAAATASGSKAPIPVITYRDADFADRRAALERARTGIIYPAASSRWRRTRTFAAAAAGQLRPGDRRDGQQGQGAATTPATAPGVSGLQAQYDETLAGTAGVAVAVASADGGPTLFEKAATDGADVETTLDPAVQDGRREGAGRQQRRRPRRRRGRRRQERRRARRGQHPRARLRPGARPATTRPGRPSRSRRATPASARGSRRSTRRCRARHPSRSTGASSPTSRASRSAAPDLLPGLHHLVQHGVRRAVRRAGRRRPARRPRRRSASAPAGASTLGVSDTFAGSVPATTGRPTRRPRRSARAGSRSPRSRWR